jgi:hypothetical protein
MKKDKKKQKHASAPKDGKTKRFGNSMAPLFGVSAKKPEPDTKPPAKNPAKVRSARMARLHGKLI